jgi:excinuclease UvrABC ATPase subunit
MKGIRRNELNPFLRRLAKEGLWDLSASFERLDREKRNLILFGFWSRPGAGSFLKSPSANPSEAASWLRWDGLYRHILAQTDRSPDAEWARGVHQSAHMVRCLRCEGSGLQPFAELLRVGDLSFTEWTRLSDPDRRLDLLRNMGSKTPRQRRTQERILRCLAPVAQSKDSAAPIAVVEQAVKSFTTMEAAIAKEPSGS